MRPTLTMSYFGLLCTVEDIIHNEAFNLMWNLCVQDVQPHFTITGALLYISVYLKISKTDAFWQGMVVIIGCSYNQVCGPCVAMDLIQHHHASSSAPNAPFFHIASVPLNRDTMVSHIKFLLITWASIQAFMPDTSWEMGEWQQPLQQAWQIGKSNLWGIGEERSTSHISGRPQTCGPPWLRGWPPPHPAVLSTITGSTQWWTMTDHSSTGDTSLIRGEKMVVNVNPVLTGMPFTFTPSLDLLWL